MASCVTSTPPAISAIPKRAERRHGKLPRAEEAEVVNERCRNELTDQHEENRVAHAEGGRDPCDRQHVERDEGACEIEMLRRLRAAPQSCRASRVSHQPPPETPQQRSTVAAAAGEPSRWPRAAFKAASTGMPIPAMNINVAGARLGMIWPSGCGVLSLETCRKIPHPASASERTKA